MVSSEHRVFEDIQLDHILFYVGNTDRAERYFTEELGFERGPFTRPTPTDEGVRTVELGDDRVRLVLSEPLVRDHPATTYVDHHGDGVADIALRVPDTTAAFAEAVRRGARPLAEPATAEGMTTASIAGIGDVTHTFVAHAKGPDEVSVPFSAEHGKLLSVDHFAVCVEHGHIDATVDFYRQVLDFELLFSEKVVVGDQAMTTKVVQSRSGSVTLTLVEPDTSREPGHIDDFLKQHDGPGVQHIAFGTEDIVEAISALRERGVEFMATPDSYYDELPARIRPHRYSVEEMRDHGVLVDEDHDGQLYQIFTRSAHPRGTLFLEIIERFGARSFGSGNITALYEAAERQRDDAPAASG
ncbi:4-hydroxymandelate synthase [Actinopolyspora mzabensis]|uniref:4-hydroxymandelate synthase n=1 Tax=Actinopolyspora mzabensis TaxID=995066 RepID=A0A1G8Y3D9_ACTMZ|nr:4-hydroxyphenylpyruvate dioxygenase [Actinopolyspora mzabensis]SDJ97358.1 4-hydroxymandelate synthase [Actinopolyspora mzabensis]